MSENYALVFFTGQFQMVSTERSMFCTLAMSKGYWVFIMKKVLSSIMFLCRSADSELLLFKFL